MTPDLIARYDQRIPRYTSYPTAPHFTAAIGPEAYVSWLRGVPASEVLSLYIHVPFCAELCLYCGCHTTVVHRYTPVAAYVDLLEREIALVAAELGGRRPVTHLHWGGGTPTILSPKDLRRISATLAASFDIRPGAEIAIEIDPRTLTLPHVAALAEIGVTRASLGVQDFDPTVQATIKRIQSYEMTAQVAGWLRNAGIVGINLDLMYGLPHQSEATVRRSVEQALRLAPDRIALFGYAHVPWMKRHQALLPEAALPGAGERLAEMQAAADTIVAAGYEAIGLDHFARCDDPLAGQRKAGHLHRNFQGYTTDEARVLIGFGTSAIGTLPEGYVQNAPSTVAYREALTTGRLATARGRALTAEDRLRRAVIERLMCDLSVDLDQVAAEHGRDPRVFAREIEAIDALAADGLAAREAFRVSVPEEARPLVRNVCAVFDKYLAPDSQRHARAI